MLRLHDDVDYQKARADLRRWQEAVDRLQAVLEDAIDGRRHAERAVTA